MRAVAALLRLEDNATSRAKGCGHGDKQELTEARSIGIRLRFAVAERLSEFERNTTMEKKEILGMQEARELLHHLEQFYKEPVLPLGKFCYAMERWMDCIVKNNTDPTLMQGEAGHGYRYFRSLTQMRIDYASRTSWVGCSTPKSRCELACVHCTKGIMTARRCFSKNVPICATGRDGSGSANRTEGIRGFPSAKERLRAANSRSETRRAVNGRNWTKPSTDLEGALCLVNVGATCPS